MTSLADMFLNAIIPIVGAAVPIIVQVQRGKRADREWEKLGTQRGLRYRKGKGLVKRELRGEIEGLPVRIELTKKWRGKARGTHTRWQVGFPPPGCELRMVRAFVPDGASAPVGEDTIRIGDDEFDRNVHLTGKSPRELSAYLTPERRAQVLRVLREYSGCIIHDGVIELRKRKSIEDAAKLDEVLESFLPLARVLVAEGGVAAPAILVPLEEESDEPEEEAAEEPEPPPPPEEEPGPPPVEPGPEADVAPDPPLPLEEVGAELFAGSRMGAEIERAFEERFRDRSTRGTGTLRRIDGHSSVSGLGSVSDRLAVLELPDPAAPDHGGRPVRVLIPVPDGDAEALLACLGETVSFEGRLVGCNPWLRDLHLEGAVSPA